MGKDITATAHGPVAIAGVMADTRRVAVVDIGLPDRAHCVTLGDSRTNRSAGTTTPNPPRTPRSNPAARTSERKNSQILTLGAGPCAPREPEVGLKLSLQPEVAPVATILP